MSASGILLPERPISEKMYAERWADDTRRSNEEAEMGGAVGLRQLGREGRLMRIMTWDRESWT